MARSRIIKPSFCSNEDLAELDHSARLLFILLWTLADKAGKLEDRPKRIKAEVFPYDDISVDAIDGMLGSLDKYGFIVRYSVNESKYIKIRNFCKHQKPHMREAPSEIPEPADTIDLPSTTTKPGKGSAEPEKGSAEARPRQCLGTSVDRPRYPVSVSVSNSVSDSVSDSVSQGGSESESDQSPFEFSEIAARIHARHAPHKRPTLDVVAQYLLAAIGNAVNPDEVARSIDKRHEAWCEEWAKEGWKYAPHLSKWLDPKTRGCNFMTEPPAPQERKLSYIERIAAGMEA